MAARKHFEDRVFCATSSSLNAHRKRVCRHSRFESQRCMRIRAGVKAQRVAIRIDRALRLRRRGCGRCETYSARASWRCGNGLPIAALNAGISKRERHSALGIIGGDRTILRDRALTAIDRAACATITVRPPQFPRQHRRQMPAVENSFQSCSRGSRSRATSNALPVSARLVLRTRHRCCGRFRRRSLRRRHSRLARAQFGRYAAAQRLPAITSRNSSTTGSRVLRSSRSGSLFASAFGVDVEPGRRLGGCRRPRSSRSSSRRTAGSVRVRRQRGSRRA